MLYKEKFSIEGLRKHLPSYFRQLQKYEKNRKEDSGPEKDIEQKAHQLLAGISELKNFVNQNQTL